MLKTSFLSYFYIVGGIRFPSPASMKSPQVKPEGFFIEQARPRPQGSGLACRVFVSLRSSQIRHPLDVVRRSVRGLRSTGARSPHHLLSQYLVINQVKRLFFRASFTGQWVGNGLISKPNASFISLGCPACQGR